MKTLKQFYQQSNDPIRQQVLRYLEVEIGLNNNVFENFDLSNNCMYKGQYDLAIFIGEQILKNNSPYLSFSDKDLCKFDNVFFEKLEILFDSSKDHYDSKVEYDLKTKKFKILKIFLNFKEHHYSDFKQNVKTIIHELDNAFRDWESYVNNEKIHLFDFAKPGTRYFKCSKWENIFEKDYTKKLLYYLEEIEQSAYFSEIFNDVKNLKYKDYKQFLDLVEENSETYQIYNNLLVSFIKLSKNRSFGKITLEYFCKQFNEINDTNLSENEIVNEITSKLTDCVNTINKVLFKIYDEKTKTNESGILIVPNNEFCKTLKLMVESLA